MKYKKKYEAQKVIMKVKDDTISSAIGELKFANMCTEFLFNSLDEIFNVTNDPLTKKIILNAKERHLLDKLIHARLLFKDKK